MANTCNISNTNVLGEYYDFWKIKMKAFFRSNDLRRYVDENYQEYKDEVTFTLCFE